MKMNTKQTDHPAVPAGEEGCVVGKDPALAGFTMIALLLGMLLAVYALITSSSPLSAKILVLLLMLLVIVMLWRYKAIYYYYCISASGLTEYSLFRKQPIRHIPWSEVRQIGFQRGFGRYKTHIVLTLGEAPRFQVRAFCDSQIYYMVHFPNVILIQRSEQAVQLCNRFYGAFDY